MPLIAGIPAIQLQNQVYGMPVLFYYTKLVPKVLLDLIDGRGKKDKGKLTLERVYQLELDTEAIGKLILKEHPELECLVQLKDLAEKYQFFSRDLKIRDCQDKLRAIVDAEDDYCRTIYDFRKENNLEPYYVFT